MPHAQRHAALSLLTLVFLVAPVRGGTCDSKTATVAPGIEYRTLCRGEAMQGTQYRLVLGIFENQRSADLTISGMKGPPYGDSLIAQYASGRYSVVLPGFQSEAEAQSAREILEIPLPATQEDSSVPSDPAPGTIEAYTQDLTNPTGPWVVDILEVDPTRALVQVVHAFDGALGRETTRELAQRKGAIAAINGGYYRMTSRWQGDSQGALMIDGKLLSEPDRGRGAVGFWATDERVEIVFGRLNAQLRARLADGTEIVIHGINRQRKPGEVVLYTPAFHHTTLTDPGGTELVLVDGRVIEVAVGTGSRAIPSQGSVLSFGAEAAHQAQGIAPGRVLSIHQDLESLLPDPDNRWGRATSILGAGPLLLLDGERFETPEIESISRVFYAARHPRTAIGVRADGTLLLVTVDGRKPQRSVGMSLDELTDLFVELGAVSALNLDGGGSTTMVVRGETVNVPTDREGDRANSDGLLLFPKPRPQGQLDVKPEVQPEAQSEAQSEGRSVGSSSVTGKM